jgi:uncharacterized protein (TIGR02647 family)
MTEFTRDQLEEIHCLALFDLNNTTEGLKVHNTAREETIDAIKRLNDKGLITQHDGGYLTTLGQEAAEFVNGLRTILRT